MSAAPAKEVLLQNMAPRDAGLCERRLASKLTVRYGALRLDGITPHLATLHFVGLRPGGCSGPGQQHDPLTQRCPCCCDML